jgi:hypothetical protein
MTDHRFPGAPDGSYVSEEGWLVVDDEAWTEHEWRIRMLVNPGTVRRYATEEERLEARRRTRRESARRRRAGMPLRIRRRAAA